MCNPLRERDSNTFDNEALPHPDRSPLSHLIQGAFPTHDNHHLRPSQIIRKLKEEKFGTLERVHQSATRHCYLSLNRGHTVAEHLTTVTKRKSQPAHRGGTPQTDPGSSREYRPCFHCTQNQLETKPYSLISCHSYRDRSTHFPRITQAMRGL